MTMTLFFSSLPSAPIRIPRPHIWLKTDRKQFTVWYSGSVYPRYVWATHRLCYYPKLFSEIQSRRHKVASLHEELPFVIFLSALLSPSVTLGGRNLTFLGNSFADPSGRTVSGVGLWTLACSDCGLESRREGVGGHGCLLRVLCVVMKRSLRWGRSLVRRSPTKCGVYIFFPVGN